MPKDAGGAGGADNASAVTELTDDAADEYRQLVSAVEYERRELAVVTVTDAWRQKVTDAVAAQQAKLEAADGIQAGHEARLAAAERALAEFNAAHREA